MGQVPVTVFGTVNLGDYIIPNGRNNGVGYAVAPKDIKSDEIKNIVGIAWSTSEDPLRMNLVNVAVGLNVVPPASAVSASLTSFHYYDI
ncbi:MAG: hypothetical protein IPP42_01615 [Saprospiraceae bacterium]|nr:hypothetical protein [Saprospiraceae bacterium]